MYNIQYTCTKSKHKNRNKINMKTLHPLSTPGVHYHLFTDVQLGESRTIPLNVIDMHLFFHDVFKQSFHKYNKSIKHLMLYEENL